jgi:hypothetical protein
VDLKHILAILLITSLLFPPFTKGWIWIDFKINQDLIAQTQCVNKEKPQTTCNGKCYLKKQLTNQKTQAEKQTQQSPPTTKIELTEIIGLTGTFFTHTIIPLHFRPGINFNSDSYAFMFVDLIWHPPRIHVI